jgi:hypothetical protein
MSRAPLDGGELFTLAARPQGVCAGEITTGSMKLASNRLGYFERTGRLFKLKTKYHNVRYFTTEAARAAYSEPTRPRHVMASLVIGPYMGVKAEFEPETPMVIPPHVKVQVCPPYRPRFTEVEMPNVFGGNQRGRVS